MFPEGIPHPHFAPSLYLLNAFLRILLFILTTGSGLLKLQYFPPKFSPTASALVNKKIVLNDISGKQWNVTVSSVDSSFTLKEGWNAFSSDHGLEVGDFLVFSYIYESHFYVEIYDRSGCEIRDFSRRRNKKKRSRDRSGSPVRGGMPVGQGPNASVVSEPDVPEMNCHSREVDVERTPDIVENISKYDKSNSGVETMDITENCEDPCRMSSEDHCGVGGSQKITRRNSKVFHVDYGSHGYQNDATLCNKYPLFEGILGSGAATNASEIELSGKRTDLYNKTSTLKLERNRKNDVILSNREVQECQCAEELGTISFSSLETLNLLRDQI